MIYKVFKSICVHSFVFYTCFILCGDFLSQLSLGRGLNEFQNITSVNNSKKLEMVKTFCMLLHFEHILTRFATIKNLKLLDIHYMLQWIHKTTHNTP